MGTRHRWAPRHNPMQLRCDSPTRKNPPIIAHEKKCYQGAKILLQHIVTVVTNVTVPTRTTDDAPSAPPNAPPPLTHIYMKTYEPAMLTGVASSLSQGPSRCPLSNNERHRNCKKILILTSHEVDMLSGAHHHCPGISSHSATKQLRSLERRTARGYLSFSYDCYTSPNI